MKYSKIILFFLALVVMSVSVGCKKDHRVLGNDVLPAEDELNATQLNGISVTGYSKSYENIVSINSDLKYLGVNQDGTCGKLDIGLYTNANMAVTNVDFGATAQLLSSEIVLVISNTDILGKKNSVLTYSVFTLDSTLKSTRAYYTSNNNLHNTANVVGATTSSYTSLNGKLVVRIPINTAFATAIMANKAALASNETFQAAYKGFYIKAFTTSDEGIIYRCDLSDDLSGFYLRYKTAPSATDTINFRFSFNGSSAARFNTAQFTALPALSAQLNGATEQGANGLYLKGMGASKLHVQIPFLKNYGDTFNVAINRAELFFYPDEAYLNSLTGDANLVYRTPSKLALLALDSLGKEILTLDQRNTNYISRYDGNYDAEHKRYVFNIPLHVQAILKGTIKNYGFALVIADPDPLYVAFRDQSVEGTLLQGANGTQKPVLNLSYIRL